MNNVPNANMMASMSNQNMGGINGNMNGGINGANGMSSNAGSPRMGQPNGNMPNPARPLSSGHMPNILSIQNTFSKAHPDWSQEQVHKAASDHLSRAMAKQQQQKAMTAAAGSPGMSMPQLGNNHYSMPSNVGMANSPPAPNAPNAVQNYQQQLVQQQRMMSQAQARQQAGSPAVSGSRSATPQNPQMVQSPSMQQAQVNRS
jgi:chromatin modification-related protein VID21